MPRVNQNNVPSISSPSFSGITPNRGIVGTVEGLSIAIKNKVLVLGKRDSSKLIGSFKTMTVMFEAYSKTIHDLISQFSCSREIKIDDDFNQAIDDGKKILSAVGDINESFSSHKSHQTNLLKVIVSPVFKFIVLKGEIFLLNQKLNQIYQQNDKRFDELNDDIRKVTDAYVFNQENDCVLGKSSQSITKHDLNKLYVKNNEFLECCSAYSDFYLELDAHCSNLKAVVSEIVTDNELYQSIYRQLEDSGYRQDEPYVDGTKPNDFANRLSKVVLLSANMTHAVISTFGIIHSGVSELLSCVNQKEILSLCRDVETLVLYIKEQNGVFNKEIAEQFIVPMLKTLSQKLDHDSLFFMQAYVVQDLNKLSTEEQKIISSFFNCFSRFSGFVEHLVKYVQESTISKKESSQGFKSSFVYADLPKEYMHDDFTEIIGMKEAKALMISNLLKDIDSFKFLFFKDLSPVASISELENTTQTLSTQETELQQFSAEPQLESIQKSHEPIIVSPVIKKLKERIRLMLKIKEQAESLQKKINHTKAMLFQDSPKNVMSNLKLIFHHIDNIKNKVQFFSNYKYHDYDFSELKSSSIFKQLNDIQIVLNKLVSKFDLFKNKMKNPDFFADLFKLYQNPNAQLVLDLINNNEIESFQFKQCINTKNDKILEYEIRFKPLKIFHERNLLPLWLHVHVQHSVPTNVNFPRPDFSNVIVAHLKNNSQRGYGANWDEIQKRQSLFHNLVKRSQVYNELYNKIIQFPQLM